MLTKHREHAKRSVKCAVVTVSDSRTEETDKSGNMMMEYLKKEGHEILQYVIIPDEREVIQNTIKELTSRNELEAVLLNGGTGISYRDVTIEAIQPMFSKEIPGFGELFRVLSYELDIGSASMLSRAVAGVINNRIVFSAPGSSKAVKLAMEKLILPELGHAVKEVTKDLNKR